MRQITNDEAVGWLNTLSEMKVCQLGTIPPPAANTLTGRQVALLRRVLLEPERTGVSNDREPNQTGSDHGAEPAKPGTEQGSEPVPDNRTPVSEQKGGGE